MSDDEVALELARAHHALPGRVVPPVSDDEVALELARAHHALLGRVEEHALPSSFGAAADAAGVVTVSQMDSTLGTEVDNEVNALFSDDLAWDPAEKATTEAPDESTGVLADQLKTEVPERHGELSHGDGACSSSGATSSGVQSMHNASAPVLPDHSGADSQDSCCPISLLRGPTSEQMHASHVDDGGLLVVHDIFVSGGQGTSQCSTWVASESEAPSACPPVERIAATRRTRSPTTEVACVGPSAVRRRIRGKTPPPH